VDAANGLTTGGLANGFEIEVGQGLIDPQLAALLHIDPNIGGGHIDFGLEAIDGDPSSSLRAGFDHRGLALLQIDVVGVPEPASAWLALTAVAAWMVRRRSRKA
jgi:hypothetical protein